MRAVTEVLGWWLGLTGLWLLTLSSPAPAEVVAGALGALACAWVARAARKALRGDWRFRARWLAWPARVPLTAVREAVLTLATVARHPSVGEVEDTTLPREPGATREARIAAATMVLGSTPGTMVVTHAGGRLLVHRLPGGGSAVLRRVSR
ncbi:Na+/H+ antiporter subunit E [Amycolatopsis sp. FDAARGOS 1241]|uniref:Na+/H+ antiporter subunit E n=1 Tax=Amycolatopsis sp. FDAARGOS 1241 TaxID=2778070 RepID=UPI00195144AB|nr:Na+/H+ antiporter subunit E [Amycolatopsis sp. FDAARGOS 1241]QRP49559.1 Na+/H+ antiporter subunit E [Amycolatopsis sp. FDAARGOS 1241]